MINIVQGEDKTVSVQLAKTSGYVDLTLVTEISVKIPTNSATPIEKKLTVASGVVVTSAVNGTFEFSLSKTETLTLKAESSQDWQITVDIGTNRKIYDVLSNMNVTAPIF